jgi:hypothetical protein
MNIQTSKDEDFLKINDVENGLVIFIPHPEDIVLFYSYNLSNILWIVEVLCPCSLF